MATLCSPIFASNYAATFGYLLTVDFWADNLLKVLSLKRSTREFR